MIIYIAISPRDDLSSKDATLMSIEGSVLSPHTVENNYYSNAPCNDSNNYYSIGERKSYRKNIFCIQKIHVNRLPKIPSNMSALVGFNRKSVQGKNEIAILTTSQVPLFVCFGFLFHFKQIKQHYCYLYSYRHIFTFFNTDISFRNRVRNIDWPT